MGKYQVWYLDEMFNAVWLLYDEVDCPLSAIALLNELAGKGIWARIERNPCVEVDSNG